MIDRQIIKCINSAFFFIEKYIQNK